MNDVVEGLEDRPIYMLDVYHVPPGGLRLQVVDLDGIRMSLSPLEELMYLGTICGQVYKGPSLPEEEVSSGGVKL